MVILDIDPDAVPGSMDHAQAQDRTLAAVALVASALVTTLGAVVLIVGWWLDVDQVTRVLPSLVSMKANTAAGFIICGLTGAAVQLRPQLIRPLGTLTIVLGLATTAEYLFGVDLNIDELLASDAGDAFTQTPGRMGLNSALSFTAFGVAAVTVPLSRDVRNARMVPSTVAAFVGLALPLLAASGYLVGVTSTVGLGSTTQMALHTSAGFLVLSAAWIDPLTRAGPGRVVRSSYAGGRSVRRFLPVVVGTTMMSIVPLQLLQRSGYIEEPALVIAFGLSMQLLFFGLLLINVARRLDVADRLVIQTLAETTAELERRVDDRTRELEAVTEELERSNNDLNRFAQVASHDLREPMRMVVSFSKKLQQRYGKDLDDRGRQYLAFLDEGASRMETLVEAILSYSQVGGDELHRTEVEVRLVLGEVKRSLAASIDAAGGSVTIGPMPSAYVDRAVFSQIMQNLVSNALKFVRPRVPPEVVLGGEIRPDGWAEFTVDDNGIGIAAEFRHEVFDLFRRLHARTAYEGFGTGLAFAKRHIDRHGGTIGVEASPLGGARIRVAVPPANEGLASDPIQSHGAPR